MRLLDEYRDKNVLGSRIKILSIFCFGDDLDHSESSTRIYINVITATLIFDDTRDPRIVIELYQIVIAFGPVVLKHPPRPNPRALQ